ncbi:hypothetical protein B0O99DRAFT_694565 [Bisporella sp. PMI_857]|nr:hypothetical protein B0O99DRAFT_694565 [Bisporella sp. PMI_857]
MASLNHLKDDPLYKVQRPYEFWLDEQPDGLPKTNVQFELYHNVPVVDARAVGMETFSIEEEGFQFLHQQFPDQFEISGSDAANSSPEQRQSILEYLEHMAGFLCKSLGGERAISYDWRVRRSRNSPVNKVPKIYTVPDELDARTIAIDVDHQVHADGSPNGIKKSLSYLLTENEKQEFIDGVYCLRVIKWGAEEVTFADLINSTGKSKVGYSKIRFCGNKARRDKLHYFWVDTCCIDKSNSTELAEAINSMFR